MIWILLTLIPFLADISIAYFGSKIKVITKYTRYIIAFASGVVIGASFFELMPKALLELPNETVFLFLAFGFFTFYFIEKISLLHACGEPECEVHEMTKYSVLGMASDNILDGLTKAIVFLINPFFSLIITTAVISHEIPQALSSLTILKQKKASKKEIFFYLFIAGIMYPIGGLLSFFIPENFFTPFIAFVAGVFLYIGAGDLLMEAHKKLNIKIIFLVALGLLFLYLIHSLENLLRLE